MKSIEQRPIRILQVVGKMNRAGVETWLMHILRHIDRDRFQIDFLVHTTQPCAYDNEIRALGSKIIPCLYPSPPWIYASQFKRILNDYGPYDIVHSHLHHFSGYILRLSKQTGVPIRIAHSHLDSFFLETKASFYRRLYITLTKSWIARYSTQGLACSCQAASDLFGSAWKTDSRWQILYYGIDLTPYQQPVNPIALRSELGLPKDAFVIGHVGRFEQQKNHVFLLDVAAEVAKREPRMRLLLVGDGALRPDIEQKIAQMGLSERVILTGVRSDVSRLMLGAMDMFLFPSFCEGLGIVLIEAQAAGLPCFISDVIPEEADVIKPLIKRLSLSQPASVWAETILTTKKISTKISMKEAFNLVERSRFNIQVSLKQLEDHYHDCFISIERQKKEH
jgi:glycosyltransferase involved in cell wall biosynthesis